MATYSGTSFDTVLPQKKQRNLCISLVNPPFHYEAGEIKRRDFDSSGLHCFLSLRQANIEVFSILSSFLNPPPLDSNLISHLQQLFSGIGYHVAHHHTTKSSFHVIYIDSHHSSSLSVFPF